jgi:hypothetical protein
VLATSRRNTSLVHRSPRERIIGRSLLPQGRTRVPAGSPVGGDQARVPAGRARDPQLEPIGADYGDPLGMSIPWCKNPGMALRERRAEDGGLTDDRRRLVWRYMVDADTAERVAIDAEPRPAYHSPAPPPTSTHTALSAGRPTGARRVWADGRALVGLAVRLAARRSVETITFAVHSIMSAARDLDRPEAGAGDLVLAAITLCISVGIGMAVASVI